MRPDVDCEPSQLPSQRSPHRLEQLIAGKDDYFRAKGVVVETLPNATFRVKLENEHEVLAYLSGKMRQNYIRVLEGDRVKIEMSPYDLTRGRVTYRYK